MDGSINGKSSLRFVKNKKAYNIKKLALSGIIFFFTNYLSFRLFKQVDYENIHIRGSEYISINNITENSSLEFPSRLIFVKTKLIEEELKQNLFLKRVSINRQIFPFGIIINIQTRNPVALAEKDENGIKVKGFVDEDGFFIKEKYLFQKEKFISPIKITGWNEDLKKSISLIIKKYKNSKQLKYIKISSEGFITLEENFFQKIFLGSQIQELEKKLNLIFDIQKQYKKKKTSKKIKSLDLTDLNNPKIKVFIP